MMNNLKGIMNITNLDQKLKELNEDELTMLLFEISKELAIRKQLVVVEV